jgi:hypothetical protein
MLICSYFTGMKSRELAHSMLHASDIERKTLTVSYCNCYFEWRHRRHQRQEKAVPWISSQLHGWSITTAATCSVQGQYSAIIHGVLRWLHWCHRLTQIRVECCNLTEKDEGRTICLHETTDQNAIRYGCVETIISHNHDFRTVSTKWIPK